MKPGARRRQGARALTILVAVSALVAALPGCSSEKGPQEDSAALEVGRTHFERLCATCHGKDGTGMPGLGRSLVANSFVRSLSDEALAEFLARGRSASDPANLTGIEMPPRGGDPSLTDHDLAAVVAYLRTF